MKSNTQIIWQDFLQMLPFLPSKPAEGRECWLCGGSMEHGWTIKSAMGPSFADHNIAARPDSESVCDACAALTSKEAWVLACEKFGHSPYFPPKDGKPPFLMNWMFSSHVFFNNGWLSPSRAEMREILLNPPEPPFVITLAEVGKKHVIFRAPVNHDRDRFAVQFDEHTITVDRCLLAETLSEFEAAYELGLSKDSLVTGNYNQAACMKIGVQKWREIDAAMAQYRRHQPGLLKITSIVAKKTGQSNFDGDNP